MGAIKIQWGAGSVLFSMNKSLTIDTASVLSHFMSLISFGIPGEILEETLGITKDELQIRDGRVPFLNNFRMIEKGIELIGPEIPLRLGSKVSFENMGACGHIFQNCKNLEEAVHHFFRYQRLLYAVSEFTTSWTPHSLIITHGIRVPLYQNYNQISVELAFSSIITGIETLVGKEIDISQLRFSYKKPDDMDFYHKVFKAPMRFNHKADMIVLDKSQLNISIPNSNLYLKETLVQHANGLMTDVESESDFKEKVKTLVMANLHNGNVDIEMISEKLNMSRWTMARKLKKEGTTFKNLINKLKMDTAINYLGNKKMSITDIAFLLGYSETSVFSRAFKSWTGVNPSGYKRT